MEGKTVMIRVLLVDDHAMIRTGCRHVLENAGGFEIVGEAGSAEEALPMVRSLQPDVVLMDLNLPGASGLQATEHITATQPKVKVIVLTVIEALPLPKLLLNAGAWGYLTKQAPGEELVQAVRQVSQGRRYLSPEIANGLAMLGLRGGEASPLSILTVREMDVALALARGDSNKKIAGLLHMSEKTVSSHKLRILEKLEVDNVVALANLMSHYQLLERGIEPRSGLDPVTA
jgi:two-component system invasion response regulator UvrY